MSLKHRLTKGAYPYAYFKDKTGEGKTPSYTLKYQQEYISLSYLDFNRAVQLHSGKLSITQQLILGLIYSNEYSKNDELEVNYLTDLAHKLENEATFSENSMLFFIEETYKKFDLTGTYYSGIIQGKAASFFLRCFEHTKDQSFKLLAKKCLCAAWKSVEEKGVLVRLPHDAVWVEEYPSPRPSMVLNGFLFYIIGLAEYLTFDDDIELKAKLDQCLSSLMSWVPNYKLDEGLLYSMYRWSFCNVHYTGIMKYQFEHLYLLTGLEIFQEYMKFADTLTNWKTFDTVI